MNPSNPHHGESSNGSRAESTRLTSLARIVEIYRNLATLLLSTLLMTVGVVVVLHFVFPLDGFVWRQNLGGVRLSETLPEEHYYLANAAEVEGIRRSMEDYVLAGHWQVHPFTGLTNREFTSPTLNIDASGRRATVSPDVSFDYKPPFRVWALGGSTMFGWGVPDRFTIPSQLQMALQELLPERQVQVINFGVPWYNSSHELALLVSSVRTAEHMPDVVVFLDGVNDLLHRTHYHRESPLQPQLEQAWEERLDRLFAEPPWIRLTPSFPLYRALGAASGSTLGGLESAGGERNQGEWVRLAASSYLTNRRMATAVCREHDVVPYFFLQPAPMWLDESRAKTVEPTYLLFLKIVGEEGHSHAFDIASALAPLAPEYAMAIEEGGVHYTDQATQLLARFMANILATHQAETHSTSKVSGEFS